MKRVEWQDVLEICGFWDYRCRATGCGAGMLAKLFTRALSWHTVNKQCAPVPKANALDAEIGGCEMLMECVGRWVGEDFS